MTSLPPITPEKNVNPFAMTSGKKKILSKSEDDKKIWERQNNQVLSRAERLASFVGKDSDNQAENPVNILSDSTLSNLKNSDKESISDLITKKREMFLVQMSLDTKREEIRKLEEKAHLKEDALHRSEQMLEEDAVRFDAFLKENDKKAHDAIKLAEEETRKKQEKLFEIKRLSQQIQQLNSEIIKSKETLDECLKYKLFLDDLTPQHLQDDPTTTFHGEDQHQVSPIYFTKTSQLMDIFAALEEQNLFLIQNSQETENQLEELQHCYTQTKFSMENQSLQLNQQIDELKAQIDKEKHRTETLKQKRLKSNEVKAPATAVVNNNTTTNTSNNNEQEESEEEKLLKELNKKVESVYEQCGFDSSSRPTTIFMLAQLESRLENLLSDINHLPQEFVLTSEKAKEKRRREKKREEQQELFIQQQEERNRKAIERSLQAPKKRTGRVIMYRSRIVNNNETKKCEVMSGAQIDEMKYMS